MRSYRENCYSCVHGALDFTILGAFGRCSNKDTTVMLLDVVAYRIGCIKYKRRDI